MAKKLNLVHNQINSMMEKYLTLEANSLEELEEKIKIAKAFGYLVNGSKRKTQDKIKLRMSFEYYTTLDRALSQLLDQTTLKYGLKG